MKKVEKEGRGEGIINEKKKEKVIFIRENI